jgi:chemotaxis protein MotB
VVLLGASLSACVPRERYDEALAANHHMRAQNAALGARSVALEGEVRRLTVEMRARDAQSGDLGAQAADAAHKVDDLVLLNAELSQRLKAAGQNVEQLASERGNLSQALSETRARLDELKRQQLAAEARAGQFREVLKSLQKMVDAGKLKVVIRRGRMLIELPNDVLFDSGKTAIKDVGRASIGEVAKALRGMKDRTFQVGGHTDDQRVHGGKFASNWELSTARAVEVTKLLVESGMDPKTLSAAGYGEFAPVADNTSDDGRAKNRRIEIALVPNIEEMVKLPSLDEPPPAAKPAAPVTAPPKSVAPPKP